MDYERIARELIVAVRGKRSQAAVNRRMGYRSNVIYTWETGRCQPSATKFLEFLARTGRPPEPWLRHFSAFPDVTTVTDLGELLQLFLQHLKGSRRISEVACAIGKSRYSVSRWLHGGAEPTFAEFLHYVEATTQRVLDLIALLVDPDTLAATRRAWRRLQTARRVAYENPWSHAVLRCLELEEYKQLPEHRTGFIAAKLGIPEEVEQECLRLLARSGQIRRRNRRWVYGKTITVDTRALREKHRDLRMFWAQVAAERAHRAELAGYNLFAVAEKDSDRIVELTRDYFEQLRAIVAQSQPSERVMLLNLSLLTFDAS